MNKVAVTDHEYDKARPTFESAAQIGLECLRVPTEENALARTIRDNNATDAIVGVSHYTGELYDALPTGGVIARFGVGHDGIDKNLATEHGILCTNTPGALDDSVAEHTLALLLAAARWLPQLSAANARGSWSPRLGSELKGRTLAVIGCGAIGRRVAQIAARGFSMNVVGCESADVDKNDLMQTFGFTAITSEFSEAVSEADFVTLHIPATPETRHFMNEKCLAQLPERAWLINTARGSIVDEVALFDALAAGKLRGAALDVFECEPYEPVDPQKNLRTLDNVIMTPHVGSTTEQACQQMAELALHNIKLAHAGRFNEMNLLNPEVGQK